jgi:hypothetical protein
MEMDVNGTEKEERRAQDIYNTGEDRSRSVTENGDFRQGARAPIVGIIKREILDLGLVGSMVVTIRGLSIVQGQEASLMLILKGEGTMLQEEGMILIEEVQVNVV